MTRPWPALPANEWADTLETLHLFSQVVGKIRMGYGPWLNHAWGVTLYVFARGLTTGIVSHGLEAFEARLDLLDSELVVETSAGRRERVPLTSTVAEFYGSALAAFDRLGLPVSIDPLPSEIAGAIRFDEDTSHGPYVPEHAQLMLRAWIDSERVMNRFRAGYLGKGSPVHLYWGGFDLAVYRYSGRTAPPHPGGAPNFPLDVAQESYTHELTAAGLWFGSREVPHPGYFAYTYPEPDGIADARVEPEGAVWSADGGSFNLSYEAVRTAADPDAALMAFLESTHAAGADLGAWDREALELAPPKGADWWRSRSKRVRGGG
ncbi:MAG: DUF5996 family protein [Candidatus Limnocylindrales bacterium]